MKIHQVLLTPNQDLKDVIYALVIIIYKCCSFIIISIDLVFGWFQDSYTGIEQEIDHVVMAGYIKGAQKVGHDLVFIVNERSELIVN